MIAFVHGYQLENCAHISHSMFRARAQLRLRYNVSSSFTRRVSQDGQDKYDRLNALYIAALDPRGQHIGSMRLLPTTGATELNERHSNLFDGRTVRDQKVWECSKFCAEFDEKGSVAKALLGAGAFAMRKMGVEALITILDESAERTYRRNNLMPEIASFGIQRRNALRVGVWRFNEAQYHALLKDAELIESDLNASYYCESSSMLAG